MIIVSNLMEGQLVQRSCWKLFLGLESCSTRWKSHYSHIAWENLLMKLMGFLGKEWAIISSAFKSVQPTETLILWQIVVRKYLFFFKTGHVPGISLRFSKAFFMWTTNDLIFFKSMAWRLHSSQCSKIICFHCAGNAKSFKYVCCGC